MAGDGGHLILFAEDGPNEGNECPVCGRDFHQDEWVETARGGDAWGGQARYECPTEGCEGTASVNF